MKLEDFDIIEGIRRNFKSIASPVLKTEITIYGTHFGTDLSKVHVYLNSAHDGETIYELSVYEVGLYTGANHDVDDDSYDPLEMTHYIHAILGGGHTGKYFIRVHIDDFGDSNKDHAFEYIIKICGLNI